MIDFCVSPHTSGIYDLHIENGVIAETDTFLTAILMTLYGEQRATSTEVLAAENRRGWWGDLLNTNNHQLGSKLWFLTQTRSTDDLLSFIITHLEERLRANFVDDNFSRTVEVSGTRSSDVIKIEIRFKVNDSVDVTIYNAWFNLETSDCLLLQKGRNFTVLVNNPIYNNENELKLLVNKDSPTADDFNKLLLLAIPTGNFTYIAASSENMNNVIGGSSEDDLITAGDVNNINTLEQFYLVTEGSNNIISFE